MEDRADRDGSPQQAVWVLDAPVPPPAGDKLVVTLAENTLGCVRVSVSPLASFEPVDTQLPSTLAAALQAEPAAGGTAATTRPADDAASMVARTYFLSTDADPKPGGTAPLAGPARECRGGKAPTVVTVSQTPRVMRVLPRGNWQDESGERGRAGRPALPAAAQGRRLAQARPASTWPAGWSRRRTR